MKRLYGLIVLALIAGAQTGWAVDACDQDRPKVCGGVTPGQGAVHDCMMMQMSSLSPACASLVQKSDTLVKQFVAQCQHDARRFCAAQMDLRPNEVRDCVKRHKDKFSSSCKKMYTQFKGYNYPIFQ